jgi:cobalt-zinc-cadmium efflux system protein
MHGGHHHHHHGDDHHAHNDAGGGGRYSIAIALNAGFVLIEGFAGFWSNSTALIADAGHNLSDVLGLVLAGGATWLARRAPTLRRTYGFSKATVLAALTNGVVLVAASGAIAWEALRRFSAPEPIRPDLVMIVAACGVVLNGGTALLFARGRKGDVNARGAYLHMMADAAVSLGVIVAGFLVLQTGWHWIDPVASLAIVAVILLGTWDLMRESLDMALDAAPRGVDVAAVRAHLEALPGVEAVHDLHIWAMSAMQPSLIAHLVRPDGADDAFLGGASASLREKFGIGHATLQIERAAQLDCDDHAHP